MAQQIKLVGKFSLALSWCKVTELTSKSNSLLQAWWLIVSGKTDLNENL